MNGHSMVLEDDSFGSFLEKRGNVSRDLFRIIHREMQKQKTSLEKTLLSLSIFNEKQLAELFSQFSKLPFINLLEVKSFSSEVQKYFPKDLSSPPSGFHLKGEAVPCILLFQILWIHWEWPTFKINSLLLNASFISPSPLK